MTTTVPKVSVIIPCYNAEKYLNRCMQSLNETNYDNKEVIFVNDGSKDSTKNILDKYQEMYSYVKVIHQDNSGVSSARNTGLDNADGDYIMFVDPDDIVAQDFISIPAVEIEKSQCDMLLFGFYVDWGGGKFTQTTPKLHYDYSSNEQILEHFFPRIYGFSLEQLDNWLNGGGYFSQ